MASASPLSLHKKLDIAAIRLLVSSVGRHFHRLLSDPAARSALQRRCAVRLASAPRHPPAADFSDHSVLSDLYWGVESVEAAARANDDGAARLGAAERLLQVPAMLDEEGTTAGVHNRFLVCCSYFYLALVRKMQGDDWQVTTHFLQALLVCPRYVRTEFAPELCGSLWGRYCKDGRGEDEVDEAMRRQGRRYKDWLMYYQVVSYGETPRWIKGGGAAAVAAAAAVRNRELRVSMKCDSNKDPCFVEFEDKWPILQDGMVLSQQYVVENKGREKVAGDKTSMAELLELQNIDQLEDGMSPRRLDEVYYQDKVGGFDIKRLQEMLEESQSDSTDSFYSQIDSTEGSDVEVKMLDKRSPKKTLPVNADISAPNIGDRNCGNQSPSSSHKCLEISTVEAPRYSMHIEACSFKTSYLLSANHRNLANELDLSILGIHDVHTYPSYKCYVDYGTPPLRSPAHEFRCFGQFPSKLLRKYGFAELLPRGTLARRKLNFANIEKDWSEENSNYENDMHIEFMGRFEKALSTLCFSEKSKDSGLEVMNVWEMLNHKCEAKYSTLKQQILHQLLDILSTSKEEKFIRASISILLLLVSEDKSVLEDIKRKSSHLDDLARALKMNVHEASILIYMLKPSPKEIKDLELLPALVDVICNSNSNKWVSISLPLSPVAASIAIIEILVTAFDYATNNMHLEAISSPQILSKLVNVARSKNLEEGTALAGILVRCMRLNGNCRKFLSQVTPVDPFLHLLRSNDNRAKCAALEYFHEILRMPRSSATVLLHQIRKQGGLNILHSLMACLQRVQQEHKLLAANLLLQLDMLDDSCGKSVFKEEALDVLIEAITSDINSSLQILAAFILSNLGGTYAWTGEPYTSAWLVKKAGLSSLYSRNMIRNIDWHDPCLQEADIDTWSSKIAKGILKLGNSIINALAKGIESDTKSVSRDSLTAISWLVCEMAIMGSSTLRYSACEMLLSGIVRFLHPGSELDERVLACLCVYNFASGKGMQKLTNFSEGVRESLRRLSSTTWMAEELLKVTDYFIPTKPRVSCVHTQILEAGKVGSGAVTALIFYKGLLCGGYSDGSIKIWDIKGQTSKLVWEAKEHKKPVTCFSLFEPRDSLLSGSVDKTVREWQMAQKKLECVEIIEIKEPVYKINTCGERIFVVAQSKGLKVYHSSRIIKIICKNKHVKCLAVAQTKVYLGFADSSVLEVDIMDNQEHEFQSPAKIWRIQNKPINSMSIYKSWLYYAGANVEESNVKDWRRRNKHQVSMTMDRGSTVQEMAVVEDFIYLTCNSSPSIIQMWLRGKQQKVGRLSAGSKITSLITANDIVLCGTETGLIKGWIPL